MKSKLLYFTVILLLSMIVISLGYKTEYIDSSISISNIKVFEYDRRTKLSVINDNLIFSSLSSLLFTWYTSAPTYTNVLQNPTFTDATNWTGEVADGDGTGSAVQVVSEHRTTWGDWELSVYDNDATVRGTAKVYQQFDSTDLLISKIEFEDVSSNGPYLPLRVSLFDSSGVEVWYNANIYSDTWAKTFTFYPNVYANKIQFRVRSSKAYNNDFTVTHYIDNVYVYTGSGGDSISQFQITFDYDITPTYTVAYQGDIGKSLNTFNYTINIYHNVDDNQTWFLAHSVSYVNSTQVATTTYQSPWTALLTGTYTSGWHNYYYKIEVVVEAFDSITGNRINNTAYLILSDQFYWESIANFNGFVTVTDTNLKPVTRIEPISIILVIIIILSTLIYQRRTRQD